MESLDAKLIECLDALEMGESVEQVLARYPEDAEQLRPMLETAARLAEFRRNPSLAAQLESRNAFLGRASALRGEGRRRPGGLFRLQRLMLPVASLVMLLLLGAGFISASSSAVPGEYLYDAKLFIEDVRRSMTSGLEARERLADELRRERLREIRSLQDAGDTAQVEFEGVIEQVEAEYWVIAGLTVLVNEETSITGFAEVGQVAEVVGLTRGGMLFAGSITVHPGARPSPTPVPPVTITPERGSEPPGAPESDMNDTPTPTATPSPTTPSVDGPDPTPTPTSTPTKTASPTPTKTAVPTSTPDDDGGSGDDANDNDDDENENESDNSGRGNGNDNTAENSNDDDGADNDNDSDSHDNDNDNDDGNGNDNGGSSGP